MPVLVIVLFGTGLFLTVRLRVVQLRRLREAMRAFFGGQTAGGAGALTPFQAFMTALAATIGTGNIAGVAAGIVSGGPGVLFWIWCYGFFATSIKFSEAVLGLTFRQAKGDQVQSGPMYYLRDGLRSPSLALAYAVVAGIAALTTTPFTQTNSIALVMNSQVGVPFWISGITIAVLTCLVIIGGIKSIGRAGQAAPPKVGLYRRRAVVILSFASRIPEVLALFCARHNDPLDARFGIFIACAMDCARALRERGRLRHSRGRVRHRADVESDAAGAAGRHGGLHRVVRHLDDYRHDDPSDRRVDIGADQHGGSGSRVQCGDARFWRLRRRVLCLSVWLHDSHRLGVLRRAVPRVLAGASRRDAVPRSTASSSRSAAVTKVAWLAWGI